MKALAKGFSEISKKPLAIIPALIVLFIIGLIFWLVSDSFVEIIFNTVFLEDIPDSTLAELPFHLFSLYALDFIILGIWALVSALLVTALGFYYAAIAKGSGITESIGKTIEQAKNITSVFALFLVLAVFFAILFWIFLILGTINLWLFIVPEIIITIAAVFITVKIAFTIPIIEVENTSLKKALEKSWKTTDKKFWLTLAFLIILGIILNIILGIGSMVSDIIPEETIGVIVFAVFASIMLAYAGLTMAFYYLEKK